MKKTFFVFAVSLFFTSFSTWSQTNRFDINANSGFLFFNADETKEQAEGSMYFDEQFMPCKITCFTGEIPFIRYNAYKDEMEFKRNDQLFYLAKNDTCAIAFATKVFRYAFYTENEGETSGYLEILNEEPKANYSLYKKSKIKLQPAEPAINSYKEDKPAKFTPEKAKYFIKVGNQIVEFPKKKKDIIAFFEGKKEAVEKYLKENRNALNSDKDMISFINFVNTL
ncbi:MAG: hypothetical protein RLZZ500_1004 [Bacteroidota bacterium]|jgi:hypothetical protein